MRFMGTTTGCLSPSTSTTTKASCCRSAVRHIDDFALQQIVSVKFIENLAGIRDIYVTDLKIDPSVSHIL